jgi:hypothetical protein
MPNTDDTVLMLELAQYRSFINDFRQTVGIGGSASSRGQVLVEVPSAPKGAAFRFNCDDVYLNHVRADGEGHDITRGNYAQMGVGLDFMVDASQIDLALRFPCPAPSPRLAVAILATAEAARSQVIYQVTQQILHWRGSANWNTELLPLLRLWGEFTTDHHKRRPKSYGALGVRDYYDERNASKAIDSLRKRGFTIDS